MITVACFESKEVGYVGWPGCSWFVLQSSKVRLHFVLVDLDFKLVGELNINT